MILDPTSFSHTERYKLAIGAVVPRPIAWVSTMDAAGGLNLAPFSYFTCAATEPLTVVFCPQIDRGTGARRTRCRTSKRCRSSWSTSPTRPRRRS
ncbi:MAG: hypothetical protein R2854_30260 [Caldilineaceae bacterium]